MLISATSQTAFLGKLRAALAKTAKGTASKVIKLELQGQEPCVAQQIACKIRRTINDALSLEVYRQVKTDPWSPRFSLDSIGQISLNSDQEQPDLSSKNAIRNLFANLDNIIRTAANDLRPNPRLALRHFDTFAHNLAKLFNAKATASQEFQSRTYQIKVPRKHADKILDLLPRNLLEAFIKKWSKALGKSPQPNHRLDGSVTYSLFSRIKPGSTEGILNCSIKNGYLELTYSDLNLMRVLKE